MYSGGLDEIMPNGQYIPALLTVRKGKIGKGLWPLTFKFEAAQYTEPYVVPLEDSSEYKGFIIDIPVLCRQQYDPIPAIYDAFTSVSSGNNTNICLGNTRNFVKMSFSVSAMCSVLIDLQGHENLRYFQYGFVISYKDITRELKDILSSFAENDGWDCTFADWNTTTEESMDILIDSKKIL